MKGTFYVMNSFKKLTKITNASRNAQLLNKATVWHLQCIKGLTSSRHKNKAGRGRRGNIVCYTKGVRTRNRLRVIDHVGLFSNLPGIIIRVEHDGTRSALLALVRFANHICNYRLLANGLHAGDRIYSYVNVDVLHAVSFCVGDSGRLICMPRGTLVYDVELYAGLGGSISRSAGTFSTLMYKYADLFKCLLKFPSGLQFPITGLSTAFKGIVSNLLYKFISIGKAGRHRWLGNKPSVRGVAMNPVDHPHGGGEGKKSKKSVPRTA